MNSLITAEIRARGIINNWSIGAIAAGWMPGSTIILAGMDWKMIASVANVFEVQLDADDTKRIGAITAAAVSGKLLSEGLSLIPGIGWATKSMAAAAATKAIGEAVLLYCKARSPLP